MILIRIHDEGDAWDVTIEDDGVGADAHVRGVDHDRAVTGPHEVGVALLRPEEVARRGDRVGGIDAERAGEVKRPLLRSR